MNNKFEFERFKNLSFDDFKNLATDKTLSVYQKIGFPDEYRKGKEADIFNDIIQKLELANISEKVLLDIGPGCSELPLMILNFCKQNNFTTLLMDSKEMLDQLPDAGMVKKYEGYFPDDASGLINQFKNKIDYIVGYSIFHYVFYNTCIYKFIDAALSLLKPGGKFLIGDIPNVSKRKRFFSSNVGIEFHKKYTNTDTLPETKSFETEAQIDDGILMGIMQRYRGLGFECFLLPQPPQLSMSNRREDLLICKY